MTAVSILRCTALALLAVLCAATAALPAFAQSPDAKHLASAFAPTGALRAVINLGNPVLARRADAQGPATGVSVDLATELAKRIGVPFAATVVTSAGAAVETLRKGDVDIGFFAIDPQRSAGIDFSPPYVNIYGAFAVQQASPISALGDVDRPGVRIVVGLNSAYDLYLTREIKAATLVRAPTSPAVVSTMLADKLEVAAGVRQQIEADAAKTNGALRVLPDNFMTISQAMGLAAGRSTDAAAYLTRFVEEMKASGFVAAALRRHGIEGATVAPAGR